MLLKRFLSLWSIILLAIYSYYAVAVCQDAGLVTYTNTQEVNADGSIGVSDALRYDMQGGITVDKKTKLMWYRCFFPGNFTEEVVIDPVTGEVVIDPVTGEPTKVEKCSTPGEPTILIDSIFGYLVDRAWHNAFQAAEYANYFADDWGGYNDWRLPNINELSFTVDRGCSIASGNVSIFNPNFLITSVVDHKTTFVDSDEKPLEGAISIWSSTPEVFNPGTKTAYTITYEYGLEELEDRHGDATDAVFVLLVRDCQPGDGC